MYLKENIYGHKKRFQWIRSNLRKDDTIVEFGCGTGYMVSLPLASEGYDIYGIDLDEKSIELGKKIFLKEGQDDNRLMAMDISNLMIIPDVVISSEVFEHIDDAQLSSILHLIKSKLKSDGKLIVTVPNGYGWFELESFLWYKAGLGKVMALLKIDRYVAYAKQIIIGEDTIPPYPSTLSSSPHVQRFSLYSINRLLIKNGFKIEKMTGSVLFCGPFSNLFFSGFNIIMNFNCFLGDLIPGLASGFYIICKKID